MHLQTRTTRDSISFKATCLRALLYALGIVVMMQVVYYEGVHLQETRFSEHGPTEILQSLVLLIAIVILALHIRRSDALRQVTGLMLAFLLASLIREQDSLFDSQLFDGAWQTLVALTTLPALAWTLHHRRRFTSEFARYADSFSFGLFAGGFLCTYVFSRLYGRGSFWEAILKEHYLGLFKSAAEETTELFGYALILFAVIELTLLGKRLAAENASGR